MFFEYPYLLWLLLLLLAAGTGYAVVRKRRNS